MESNGQSWVSVKEPGSEVHQEEIIEGGGAAKVKVEYGLTLNLGNFQTARVTIGVELPCRKDEVDATYQEAAKFVEEKLKLETEAIRQRRNGEVTL